MFFLQASTSDIYNFAFLENFAHQLNDEHLPKSLREATLLFLDMKNLAAQDAEPEDIAKEFSAFYEEMNQANRCIILAITHADCFSSDALSMFYKKFNSILSDNKWRVIALSTQASLSDDIYLDNYFTKLKLPDPNTADCSAILKSYRDDLEDYHHVIIPDDSFSTALHLAEQYLNGQEPLLERSLKLLDSAASRASMLERTDQPAQSKPIVTFAVLAKIISNWTQIPLSHLQTNKFKSADLINDLQKNIFGQEIALNLIGLVLQHARIRLQKKSGPLCSLLFAGPPNVGKTETAYAIAEHLFGHKGALLQVQIDRGYTPASLAEVQVLRQTNEHHSNLYDAIQTSPFAVVLFENISQQSVSLLNLFQDIFHYGYAIDELGRKYDFRHAIIIMTTTLGSERIVNLAQPSSSHETSQPLDLIQLVLNEQRNEPVHHPQQLSPQEMCEEMLPALETSFSPSLLHQFNIVPFALLEYSGLEKIIRLKLKNFAAQLHSQYGIELSYAPEIIRFLVQESLWRGALKKSIEKVLQQHLYSCVANELVNFTDEKNRPKRLLLQLNDSGQLLRCEFMSPGDAILYKL